MSTCKHCGEEIEFRWIDGGPRPIHVESGWECPGNQAKLDRESETCQKTRCPRCRGDVYFVQHNGGCMWFDELGWPWIKHACFEDEVFATLEAQSKGYDLESALAERLGVELADEISRKLQERLTEKERLAKAKREYEAESARRDTAMKDYRLANPNDFTPRTFVSLGIVNVPGKREEIHFRLYRERVMSGEPIYDEVNYVLYPGAKAALLIDTATVADRREVMVHYATRRIRLPAGVTMPFLKTTDPRL